MDELAAREKRVLWHPFTQMRDWEREDPLFIERGEGVMLFDRQGRKYYDANSSLWVNIHGHRHPVIDAAVRDQLDRMAHSTLLGLTHEPALLLAERLVESAPSGLERVFYSDSGSEAVEIALKMAYQYWRHRGQPERTLFVALEHGYHGDTIGGVSVGGIDLFHKIFRDLLFEVKFADCPNRFPTAEGAAKSVDRLLEENRGKVAAVILEPLIQGAGGMLTQPPGYLTAVRAICDRHDVLMIVDEVATGFGRTGRLFACDHEKISPDLLCLAKGITGGYLPLAATLAAGEIYEAFLGMHEDWKTFFHGHSYTGNPLACAAGVASLDLLVGGRVKEAALLASAAADELDRLRELRQVREARQCGLMAGIELWDGARPYPPALRTGHHVCMKARELGLITRPLGDVIVFMPPLASTEADVRAMVRIIGEAIRQVVESSVVPNAQPALAQA